MARKPKLAVWKFASCDGCQLTLLDCEDELLQIAGEVEIAYFLEATRGKIRGPYDLSHDRRYAGVETPATESLKSTLDRVRPYWDAVIVPALASEQSVLIAAHGNSLRAIVKLLFGVSDQAIPGVEIPTGNPLLTELDGALKPVRSRYLDAARAQPLPAPA